MTRCARLLLFAAAVTFAPCMRAQEPANAKTENGEKQEKAKPSIGWTAANFAILIGFLGYMISKNAGKFFEARSQQIRRELAEAAKAKRESEQRVLEMERRIAGLAQEIERLRASMRQEVAAEGERIRRETERHIARIQSEAQQEIENMIKAARRELKLHSADLAVKLAEDQLRGRITKDVENNLVSSFIADIRAQVGGNTQN